MERHVKNQHYVPRFLLRNFSNDCENKIWCYDRAWKKAGNRSISNVASEDYFYDETPGKKDGSLEYFLANAESFAAPLIRKIIEQKDLKLLSQEEQDIIATFLSLQYKRTKVSLARTENINQQLMDGINNWMQEIDSEIKFDSLSGKDLWRSAFSAASDLTSILVNKHWALIESDNKFYTSDNPFVLYNALPSPVRGNLGLNSKGIQMFLPLNPSIILGLFCEKIYQAPKELNRCGQSEIDFVNSLQVISADRFVFSVDGDFSLVEDMLKNP
ncbi:DUF4238 domain-containing protein [Dyadobacter bucti]|uniref:DUF4238 domain-containing protein n=1 Tax=Dyadobacter bucti TaxID=2572203 RepID=UPI003F70E478